MDFLLIRLQALQNQFSIANVAGAIWKAKEAGWGVGWEWKLCLMAPKMSPKIECAARCFGEVALKDKTVSPSRILILQRGKKRTTERRKINPRNAKWHLFHENYYHNSHDSQINLTLHYIPGKKAFELLFAILVRGQSRQCIFIAAFLCLVFLFIWG